MSTLISLWRTRTSLQDVLDAWGGNLKATALRKNERSSLIYLKPLYSISFPPHYTRLTINYNYRNEVSSRFCQFIPSQAKIQTLILNSQQNEKVSFLGCNRICCITFCFQIHPSQFDLFIWANWIEQDVDQIKPRTVTSIKWLRNRVFTHPTSWWFWEYFKDCMPSIDRNNPILEWIKTTSMEI